MFLERRDRVLNLADDIEGIGVARVAEEDAHEGICQSVAVVRRTCECIVEIMARVIDAGHVAAEHHKPSDADEDEGDDLEGAEKVGKPERVFVVGNDN